jgi:hypothetical protein
VAPVEPVQVRQAEAAHLLDHVRAQEFLHRRAVPGQPDEHPVLPHRGGDGHEAVPGGIEVADALEGGRGLERSFERVRPAVVRALQALHAAGRLGQHGGGVVPAHVEEAAQHAVVAPHDEQRLACQLERDVLAGLPHLVEAARVLPRAREGGLLLELEDARVDVPGGRAGACLRERQARVVAVDQVQHRVLHAGSLWVSAPIVSESNGAGSRPRPGPGAR